MAPGMLPTARSGTSGPTTPGRSAGPRPTPPASPSSRAWSRWNEVDSGYIAHALRFVVGHSQQGFVWPATHAAGTCATGSNCPPMGLRVRLKQDVDISGFSWRMQVILRALKQYGMFVADNGGGTSFWLSGAPDPGSPTRRPGLWGPSPDATSRWWEARANQPPMTGRQASRTPPRGRAPSAIRSSRLSSLRAPSAW